MQDAAADAHDLPEPAFRRARSIVRQRSLNDKAPGRVAMRLTAMVAVCVAQIVLTLLYPGWASWLVIWMLVPPALLSCGAVVHEAVHGHLYDRRLANQITGVAASLPLGLSYAMYSASHLDHHRYTHGPGDPEPLELLTKPYQLLLGIPALSVAYLYTLWSGTVATLMGRPPAYVHKPQRAISAVSLLGQLAVLAALVLAAASLGVWVVLAGFVVPWAIGAAGVLSVLGLAEHYEMAWGPAESTETTRSVDSNALLRLAYWNTNYHCEHHMLPSVPCWNLRQVHEHIAGAVTTSTGYLAYLRELYGRLSRGEIPDPAPQGEVPHVDLRNSPPVRSDALSSEGPAG